MPVALFSYDSTCLLVVSSVIFVDFRYASAARQTEVFALRGNLFL